MKIYLASFLQKENFGSGKIIGITTGSKPKNIVVNEVFLPVTPSQSLIDRYYELREKDLSEAGKFFTSEYEAQLQRFVEEVKDVALKEGKAPEEILPFHDGDTLCSWERAQYTNYRNILAPYLEQLGCEVV